jgi:hypothetical protein
MVARTFETLLPIASSPSSASSSWFGKGKQTQDYLHGVSFYTAGQGGTKDGENKSVNVLLHGSVPLALVRPFESSRRADLLVHLYSYGAGLGFFFLNLQSFAEASAQNGRRACTFPSSFRVVSQAQRSFSISTIQLPLTGLVWASPLDLHPKRLIRRPRHLYPNPSLPESSEPRISSSTPWKRGERREDTRR